MDGTIVERAEFLARVAHNEQLDKGGRPYFQHIERVAKALPESEPDVVAAAYLHDAIEDAGLPYEFISSAVGYTSANIVKTLTRDRGIDYEAYIEHVRQSFSARRVKIEDLKDNLRPERMGRLDPPTREKLCKRYYAALDVLEGRTWS